MVRRCHIFFHLHLMKTFSHRMNKWKSWSDELGQIVSSDKRILFASFFFFFFLNLHLVVLHRPTVLSNQNFFFPKTKLPKGKACAWHIPSKFRVSTFDATTTLPYGASIRLDVLHPSANDVSWTVSYEDKRKLRARRDAWKYGGTAFICRTRRFHARKGSAMPASLKPFKNIQRPKRMAQHGETTEIESRTGRSRHLASSFLS